jgi:hexosaminidase
MKKLLYLILLFLAFGVYADESALIPRPVSQQLNEGTFTIKKGDYAFVPMLESQLYLKQLSKAAGFEVAMAPADVACAIQFLSPDSVPKSMTKPQGEGYILRVLPETVIIHAATAAGRFNGLQTLSQLLATADHRGNEELSLNCQTIIDSPRFEWRGYMLDESRHFTGVEGVKRLLDAMSYYKLNRFHWHLTDSPAWRIEIKKYPKLTEIGSRGSESDRSPDAPKQFYSQEQIRDIVAYAKARNITVIPEIDMPGHADAANIAYPDNSGGGYTRSPGKWPNFTFNPARPQTLEFLDNVLAEVAALFPDAGVIHLGGDEVHFGWKKWKSLPDVQDLMKREGFSELRQVETWFDLRMADTVNKLGFITAGWDELASRGLSQDKTLVFWWRHNKPQVLRKALDCGYSVVMCPRRPCYFDFVQHSSHKKGRRWGGFNSQDQVYKFPESLKVLKEGDWKQIKGIQACLWTETTVTQQRRDFMTFPRLLALAEAAWTPASRKDYASFEQRLKPHIPALKSRGISAYDPFVNSAEIKR